MLRLVFDTAALRAAAQITDNFGTHDDARWSLIDYLLCLIYFWDGGGQLLTET